jgi:hypothetical protein
MYDAAEVGDLQPTISSNSEVFIDEEANETEVIVSVTPSPLPTSTLTPQPELEFQEDCPEVVEGDEVLSLFEGSILFSNEAGVWLINRESPTPSLLIEATSGENSVFFLDDSMPMLLKIVYMDKEQDADYVFYNLNGQEVDNKLTLQPMRVLGWQLDGRIAMLSHFNRILGIGEQQELLLIDPVKGELEYTEVNLQLPQYQFFQEPSYNGLASADAQQERALYTLWDDQNKFMVALRDLETNENVWEKPILIPPYPFPEPAWRNDGEYVLFDLYADENGKQFNKLMILDQDGGIESLPTQPFPFMDELFQVQALSFSPNGRYIHYDLGYSNVDGPGIIVDITSFIARQICIQSSEGVFFDGKWLNEELFLYRTKGKGEQLSLHILHVSDWTTQSLTELDVNEYGWSPLEIQQGSQGSD